MRGAPPHHWQPPAYQEERPQGREPFHGIKLQVSSFAGTSDADACLDWIAKVESIFDFYGYDDARRVAIAAIHFSDFAYHWWQEDKELRRRRRTPQISTWQELKEALEEWFVPQDYAECLHAKLEQVCQGNRTPDEYYKELRTLIFRSGLHFPDGYVISKFINGLSVELKNIVSMQHFTRGTKIEEVLH